ncbi:MAG: hypothetical protein KW788_02065 [Candidatus Doudnabacteria bacterium]|nr:hypothetical protein [Candidatus Doudnabacteria bacterium]
MSSSAYARTTMVFVGPELLVCLNPDSDPRRMQTELNEAIRLEGMKGVKFRRGSEMEDRMYYFYFRIGKFEFRSIAAGTEAENLERYDAMRRNYQQILASNGEMKLRIFLTRQEA